MEDTRRVEILIWDFYFGILEDVRPSVKGGFGVLWDLMGGFLLVNI